MKKYLFVLLMMAAILAGCTRQITVNPPATPPPSEPPIVNAVVPNPVTTPPVAPGATKTFHIRARQFEFEPSVIEVNKGDMVVIEAETLDVGHGIRIAEFDVNLQLTQKGEVKTAAFVADTAGEFTFFCSIPCGSGHKAMSGTLIVH